MITYLLKKKVEKEAKEHGKKLMVYAGVALAGVGAYWVYKSVKKSKMDFEEEERRYLTSDDYDDEQYAELFDKAIEDEYTVLFDSAIDKEENKSIEDSELEEKINEFNSRRINCDNCPHVTKEEMQDFIDKTKSSKDEVQINPKDYKEEDYENYEYYDGHIINKQ